MNIAKGIIAVLGGLLAGGITVGIVEWISSLMHPMPEGLNMDDMDGMQQWVASLPVSAFVMLLIAWGAGCFVGSLVARWIAPGRSARSAIIVCGLLTAATIFNLIALPHPWWMWPAGILACLMFGVLGLVTAAPNEYCISTSRSIHAPIDKVFQTLASVENFSKAVPGITKIKFLSERKYGIGMRFKETRIMNGKEATTELEVTELVENERVRIVSDAGGTTWDTVFTVEQQGDSVLMEMRMAARPHQLSARLVTPMVLGMVEQAIASDMDAVKAYCEP